MKTRLICPFLCLTLSGLSNTAASDLISWTMLPNRATGFVLQRQGGFSDGQQVQTLYHPEASGHTGALSRIHLIKHSLFSSSLIYHLSFEILWFLTGFGLWQASLDKTLFWFTVNFVATVEMCHAATYDFCLGKVHFHTCAFRLPLYIKSLLFHCFRCWHAFFLLFIMIFAVALCWFSVVT